MTTGPLRFNTVELSIGSPSGSANMVGTGSGLMTLNQNGEGVRLGGLTLPSGFPSNGTFQVTGFMLRFVANKGTGINPGTIGLRVASGNGATLGTEQVLTFSNSSNLGFSVGGVRNLLGYPTVLTASQQVTDLELFIRAAAPGTIFQVLGITSGGNGESTFGMSPTIEIFYEMRDSSGDGDDIDSLNQIDAGTAAVEDTQGNYIFNFENQTHSTSSITTTQSNSSGILGWAPNNPSNGTDMTNWKRGSQCVDSTNNASLKWKLASNTKTPVLQTTRSCHSWNLHDQGTGSSNTGPYSGHVGNGLHASGSRTNEFMYAETSGSKDRIHHIVRSAGITLTSVYSAYAAGTYTGIFLEFYLYAFGPSIGNLYIYADTEQESTDGAAELLAKCMHYSDGTYSGSSHTGGKCHSHILVPSDATSGFTQISTYSYESYYNTAIPTSAMTTADSGYNTYWQRIRIPLHGSFSGQNFQDTPDFNMMTADFIAEQARQHFYFVYQCSDSTTLVNSSKTEVGNHTTTFTTSLSGHQGFFGDIAVDDVRIVGTKPGANNIKFVNDVNTGGADHIIFNFTNLYDD